MEVKDQAVDKVLSAAIEKEKVIAPADDYEAQLSAKDAEIARLSVESANYKLGMLKAKKDKKEEELGIDESDDEKFRRIAREELANSQLEKLQGEKDEILRKALKENKELKLAQLNKTDVPASVGSHSEGKQVQDTLVTPEQMTHFKKMGWSEKDIQRYKNNLSRLTSK